MKRLLLVGVGAIASVGLLAAPASASTATKFGPWKPAPHTAPFDTAGCGTMLHISFPIQQEIVRTRLDAGGNTIIEFKGPFNFRIVPKDRVHFKTITRDASGESLGEFHSIAFKNGDYLFAGTGNNFVPFHPGMNKFTGFPRLAYTRGPIRDLVHGDRSVPDDIITRPNVIRSICNLMKR